MFAASLWKYRCEARVKFQWKKQGNGHCARGVVPLCQSFEFQDMLSSFDQVSLFVNKWKIGSRINKRLVAADFYECVMAFQTTKTLKSVSRVILLTKLWSVRIVVSKTMLKSWHVIKSDLWSILSREQRLWLCTHNITQMDEIWWGKRVESWISLINLSYLPMSGRRIPPKSFTAHCGSTPRDNFVVVEKYCDSTTISCASVWFLRQDSYAFIENRQIQSGFSFHWKLVSPFSLGNGYNLLIDDVIILLLQVQRRSYSRTTSIGDGLADLPDYGKQSIDMCRFV